MSGIGRRQGRRFGMSWGGRVAAALLALLLGPSSSRPADLTSVDVQDPAGLALDAKVTVADAATGLLVASGRTDTQTGRFSFSSFAGSEFVVTVATAAGYVGSERVSSGASASIFADGAVGNLPRATYSGTTVTVDYGQPVAGIHVAIVAWSTFQPIAQGTTDENGQFQFQVPAELSGVHLLAILWSDTQVSLQGLESPDPALGPDGNEGFEAF
jgi:hypothetical protein